ncbi:hypothetical protein OA101_03210 [Alphaproteobacteria bacterium]|jgi:hypothetical protein|nr:hypothetical protein [Alphaproteobacteria bacterium]
MDFDKFIQEWLPLITDNAEVLAGVAGVIALILVGLYISGTREKRADLDYMNVSRPDMDEIDADNNSGFMDTKPLILKDKKISASGDAGLAVEAGSIEEHFAKFDDLDTQRDPTSIEPEVIAEQFAAIEAVERTERHAAAAATADPVAQKQLEEIEKKLLVIKNLYQSGFISAEIYLLKSRQITQGMKKA